MSSEAGTSRASTPPVWTLDPFDYSKESGLRPILLGMGETVVGRHVTPGLEEIGYISKRHLVFRLAVGVDGQVEGTVEYVGKGTCMGLVGNANIGDTVMIRGGPKHPIKVGDEIHLLRTHAETGGKGLKYMYTVQGGYGKLAMVFAGRSNLVNEDNSDVESMEADSGGDAPEHDSEVIEIIDEDTDVVDLTD